MFFKCNKKRTKHFWWKVAISHKISSIILNQLSSFLAESSFRTNLFITNLYQSHLVQCFHIHHPIYLNVTKTSCFNKFRTVKSASWDFFLSPTAGINLGPLSALETERTDRRSITSFVGPYDQDTNPYTGTLDKKLLHCCLGSVGCLASCTKHAESHNRVWQWLMNLQPKRYLEQVLKHFVCIRVRLVHSRYEIA